MFRSGYSISNQKLIYPMMQKKSVSGSPGIPNIQSTNIIKSAGGGTIYFEHVPEDGSVKWMMH